MRVVSVKYKNKEWMKEQIISEKRNFCEIAEDCNVSLSTISYWADKFDIEKPKNVGFKYSCHNCDEDFTKQSKKNNENVFCSRKCYQKWRSNSITLSCQNCNKGFERVKSQAKIAENHFCSRYCRAEYFVGDKHPTENTKTIQCDNCKEDFERPQSQISKENNFCNVDCYHDWCEHTKERNSNEAKKWRNDIRERDEWICQDCGEEGGNIEAHHIKSWNEYPDERFDLENGISLCNECHYIRHEERGDRRAIALMKDRVNAERVKELKKRRKKSEP